MPPIFQPIDRRRRRRDIGRALDRADLRGPVRLLDSSSVQSVYRVDRAPQALLLRWRDRRDPMDAVNAEREILDALRAAGIGGIPEWRFADDTPRATITALSFLPGRRLRGLPAPDLAEKIGRLLAAIHGAVRAAGINVGTAWDAARFRTLWEAATGELIFPASTIAFAERAFAGFAALEAAARSDPHRWGVIHSDLNASNVIIDSGEPAFIDFAEAGPGLFAWDIGMLPLDLWWDFGAAAEEAGAALLRGYVAAGGTKPAPDLLRACAEVRLVEAMTWLRPSLGEPADRCRQWIDRVLAAVERLGKAPPDWM